MKDETFMWFRSKQESLKSGWLYKKGGGLSTLSRRCVCVCVSSRKLKPDPNPVPDPNPNSAPFLITHSHSRIVSTLPHRNWKMRWFVLRDSKLMYFENDSEEKLKGTIDIRAAK